MDELNITKIIRGIINRNKHNKELMYTLLTDMNLLLETIMLSLKIDELSELPFQVTSLRHMIPKAVKELNYVDLKSKEYTKAKNKLKVKMEINKKNIINRGDM